MTLQPLSLLMLWEVVNGLSFILYLFVTKIRSVLSYFNLFFVSHEINKEAAYDVPKQDFQEEKYNSWQRSLIGSQRLFFDKKKKLLC